MKKTQDIVQYIRYNIKGILAYGCIFLVVFTILAGYTLYDRQMQLVIEYAPFSEAGISAEQECALILIRDSNTVKVEPVMPMGQYTYYTFLPTEVVYNIPKQGSRADQFMMELAHEGVMAHIKSIAVYNCGVEIARYSPYDIEALFEFNGYVDSVDFEEIHILENEDSKIIAYGTELFVQEYNSFYDVTGQALLNCAIWAVLLGLLFRAAKGCIVQWVQRDRRKEHKGNWKDWMLGIGFCLILGTSVAIAALSLHYSHPDENVSRMAVDYFLGNWRYPITKCGWTAGTRSAYAGFTRLSENTLYYLLAGKFVWFFRHILHVRSYYRFFNVACLAIMLLISWRKRNEHRWMSFAMCLAPQVWYIFSYVTSDGWDWFCGFMILYMLLDLNSVLWKVLEDREQKKNVCLWLLYVLCCSFVFAQILLGKDNYLVVLGIPFGELVLYWIKNKQKVKLLVRYVVILLFTILLAGGIMRVPRLELDYASTDRMKTVREESLQKMDASMGAYYNGLRDEYSNIKETSEQKGYSIWEMMWHPGRTPTLINMYRGVVGSYEWERYFGKRIYLYIIGGIHIGLLIIYMCRLRRCRRWDSICATIYGIFLVLALVSIEVWYCYHQTYQPQGRYLLPLVLVFGYMCEKNTVVYENRIFSALTRGCLVVGLYSFIFIGLRNLI